MNGTWLVWPDLGEAHKTDESEGGTWCLFTWAPEAFKP